MNERQLKWQLARERLRIEDRLPPPPRRPERGIKDILGDILKQEKDIAPELPTVLSDRWPSITGRQIAMHTRPVALQNGILKVYADHPGWLTEVRRLPKPALLKKIGSVPGMPGIKDVRFLLDPAIHPFRKQKNTD